MIERHARLERRHGVHQIPDRLGLHEIEPSVQERAERELAGLGQTRARSHRRGHDLAQQFEAAMGADFDDILRGVRMRTRKERGDNFVDRAGTLCATTTCGLVVWAFVKAETGPGPGRARRRARHDVRQRRVAGLEGVAEGEHRAGNRRGPRAAEPNHANARRRGRRGQGNDRIAGGEHGVARHAYTDGVSANQSGCFAPSAAGTRASKRPPGGYFRAAMMTVFMNASPMLSDVTSARSVTAMCTIRRS